MLHVQYFQKVVDSDTDIRYETQIAADTSLQKMQEKRFFSNRGAEIDT